MYKMKKKEEKQPPRIIKLVFVVSKCLFQGIKNMPRISHVILLKLDRFHTIVCFMLTKQPSRLTLGAKSFQSGLINC